MGYLVYELFSSVLGLRSLPRKRFLLSYTKINRVFKPSPHQNIPNIPPLFLLVGIVLNALNFLYFKLY
jgi:hypothetical protein